MFEERNIFMTDKFIKALMNENYLYFQDTSVITSIEMGNEITGDYNSIHFYPPLYLSEFDTIYCDVEGYVGGGIKKFYDTEYLYDIEKTYGMRSKGHKTFRHHVNIFSNRVSSRYNNNFKLLDGNFDDIMQIHNEWINADIILEKNKTLMIDLVNNRTHVFSTMSRKIFYLENEPVGFIFYDESPSYIHVFFSYAIPTIEYLHDYMMWMFFRYLYQMKIKKLVNFGGVYGDNNIKKDKDRLCPYVIRDRWSWIG